MLNTIANTKKEKYEGQAGALYPRPCLVLHLRPANFHARARTITNTKKKTKANTNTRKGQRQIQMLKKNEQDDFECKMVSW